MNKRTESQHALPNSSFGYEPPSFSICLEQCINRRIDLLNELMKKWGQFFKEAYEIYKQYNAVFWLYVTYL
jgi:hypothetical protein